MAGSQSLLLYNNKYFLGNYVQDPVLRHALKYRNTEHEFGEHDEYDSDLAVSRYGRQLPPPDLMNPDGTTRSGTCIYFLISILSSARKTKLLDIYVYVYFSIVIIHFVFRLLGFLSN